MNAVSYSLNTLKHGAIGAATGLTYFAAKLLLLERFCTSIPFGLQDYVCLRSTTYLDIKKYTPSLAPYIKLLDAIAYSLQLRLLFDPYNNHSIAYGFAEELLNRVLVQKVSSSPLIIFYPKSPPLNQKNSHAA